jgi:hypothetical protein
MPTLLLKGDTALPPAMTLIHAHAILGTYEAPQDYEVYERVET